jgi:hypothetical protein
MRTKPPVNLKESQRRGRGGYRVPRLRRMDWVEQLLQAQRVRATSPPAPALVPSLPHRSTSPPSPSTTAYLPRTGTPTRRRTGRFLSRCREEQEGEEGTAFLFPCSKRMRTARTVYDSLPTSSRTLLPLTRPFESGHSTAVSLPPPPIFTSTRVPAVQKSTATVSLPHPIGQEQAGPASGRCREKTASRVTEQEVRVGAGVGTSRVR